jgi:hypothetical protein
MDGNTSTIPDLSTIEIEDICGFWEVIKIYRDDNEKESYPWIKDCFKFNFLSEMIFLCQKDGNTIHGSWEFVERTFESQKQFFITLNGAYEFIILEISGSEMLISDRNSNYLLVRRL